jgi:serine/threonine protein kinase
MTSNPSRRPFNRYDNSDNENDEVSARMALKAKQGFIPTIPNLSIALPQSNFDTFISTRPPNNTKKFIAEGSFGVIYQNSSHSGEVIKILGPDTKIEVEKAKANTIADITGDEKQRVKIIQITKNDVPSNALIEYRKLNSKQSFMKNNQPIPALLMPYLGVDLFTYLNNRPFALPEELYLDQCHKLLDQTSKLYKKGYSHGDLRSENIVFDGTEMTIIDFDIFGTFKEVAETYVNVIHKDAVRSWTPPECLILYNKRHESSDKGRKIANDYINKLYERSQVYFSSSGKNLNRLKTLITDSNEANMRDMSMGYEISMIDVIPYLDNFGLGMALLEVLAILYPETTNEKLIKTRELLEKITQFEISKRITPDVAFAEMDNIHQMSGGRRRFIGKTRRICKNRPQGGTKHSSRRNNKQTRRRHK